MIKESLSRKVTIQSARFAAAKFRLLKSRIFHNLKAFIHFFVFRIFYIVLLWPCIYLKHCECLWWWFSFPFYNCIKVTKAILHICNMDPAYNRVLNKNYQLMYVLSLILSFKTLSCFSLSFIIYHGDNSNQYWIFGCKY